MAKFRLPNPRPEEITVHLEKIADAFMRLKRVGSSNIRYPGGIDEIKALLAFAKPECDELKQFLDRHDAPAKTAEIIVDGLVVNYCNTQVDALLKRSGSAKGLHPLAEKLVDFIAYCKNGGERGEDMRNWVKQAHVDLGVAQAGAGYGTRRT